MGSCLGHCSLTKDRSSFCTFHYSGEDSIDFGSRSSCHDINPNDNSVGLIQKMIPKESRFQCITNVISKLKSRKRNAACVRLELLDDAWSLSEVDTALLETTATPRQDFFHDLKKKTMKSVHSTPGNSLDLEWEHLPEMVHLRGGASVREKVEEPGGSATSVSAWSRVSSPDSLEWDPAEANVNNEVDVDTQQLLEEIEQLNYKTLKETQVWAS